MSIVEQVLNWPAASSPLEIPVQRLPVTLLQPPAKDPPGATPPDRNPPFTAVPARDPVRPAGHRPQEPEPQRRLFLPWPFPQLLVLLAALDLLAAALLFALARSVPDCDGRVSRLVGHGDLRMTLAVAVASTGVLVAMAVSTTVFQDADAASMALTALAVAGSGYALWGFAVLAGLVGWVVAIVAAAMVAADGPGHVAG